MKRMFLRLALVVGAIVATFAVASPSFAADNWMYTDDGDPGGKVSASWYGDIVTYCDIEADGYGVYISVTDDTSNVFKYSDWVGGNGNCETHRASQGGIYDLTEQHYYTFKICLRKVDPDTGSVSLHYCDYATWRNFQ